MTPSPLRKPTDIPDLPGCYLFKDVDGRVIYVGKALSLRKRLANYFGAPHTLALRTASMVEAATDVEWIVTASEIEALHLEFTLIQLHRPRFNIRYRDDKSYPFLSVTVEDEVPRAMVMRGKKRRGVRMFGPYAHAYAVRETLDLLLRTFPMRTCSPGVFDRAKRSNRPCLLYDIGKCAAPCVGHVDASEHREIVEGLVTFLDGRFEPVLDRLEKEMHQAAESLSFERAAQVRDQLASVRKVVERQVVVLDRTEHFDMVGLVEDDLEAAIQIFFVRGGRLVGRKGFVVDKVDELDTPSLLADFLLTYYLTEEDIPREVLVPTIPAGADVLGELLAEKRGGPVGFRIAQRGEKRALAETATQNATEAFARHKLKRRSDFAARAEQLSALQQALGLSEAPLRIECYDISNLGPTDKVGSMVVFEDGLPKKSDYRKFAIKTVEGQDDFASMAEVIRRRFSNYLSESAPSAVEGTVRKFAYPPNLIVIDGGPGQLGAAVGVLKELGLDHLAAIGLMKRFEEVCLPDSGEIIQIPRGSEALYLLQHVRDEAHRTAITYHRAVRARKTTASELDRVPGVGPARKRLLLRAFGSVRRILGASEEELTAVVGQKLARRIQVVLRGIEPGKRDG